jgi:hypothetical protein
MNGLDFEFHGIDAGHYFIWLWVQQCPQAMSPDVSSFLSTYVCNGSRDSSEHRSYVAGTTRYKRGKNGS